MTWGSELPDTAFDCAIRDCAHLQIWVPDTRAPEFAEEAHRQSAFAAAANNAHDDQAFVDAISQFNDEDFDT